MYIQEGGVRLTVVNGTGKEAVVALLGPGDFLGEGCLAGQSICLATASTIAPTSILVIEKGEMIRVLHGEHQFSDRFIAYMLTRNLRVEADLIDQLFNSSERRLARALLLLARYGNEDQPQKVLAKVSQEMLAEMIGTMRSRVNFFMNKFRKLGYIQVRRRDPSQPLPPGCRPARLSTHCRVVQCGMVRSIALYAGNFHAIEKATKTRMCLYVNRYPSPSLLRYSLRRK